MMQEKVLRWPNGNFLRMAVPWPRKTQVYIGRGRIVQSPQQSVDRKGWCGGGHAQGSSYCTNVLNYMWLKKLKGYKLQYISNYTQVATEETDSERRYFRSQRLLRLLTFRPGGSTRDLSHRWAGLFHHAAALSSWGLCVWHPLGSHRGCQVCVPLSAVTGRQASCSLNKCFLHWEGYTAIPGFPGGSHCNCDELLAQRWPCWVCTAIF